MDRCTVLVEHEIPDYHPIQLERGERVAVEERGSEWPECVRVTAASGSGWVPARHLSSERGTATVVVAHDTTELPTVPREQLVALGQGRRTEIPHQRRRFPESAPFAPS